MAAEIRITISQTGSGSAIADAKKDVADLGRSAKESGGGFSAMREVAVGALRELGAAATNAALGGLKALAGAISDGISDAREAAKINAQTEAVLKSTGNAAGVSAVHIRDYAASLSAAAGKSLFGDSQIQESTNLLATFTKIKGVTLDAATAISVDMAQALGGAPKDSAIQLGKALNDPIKGVTALTRVGVTFSQEQKDMIQALVDTGDVAGAQAVILKELGTEFGGSAEAAAKADGGWAQFNDRMGEAKEAVGTALLPLLGMLAGMLNDTVAPIIENVAAGFGVLVAAFQTGASEGGGAIGGLSNALYSLDGISPIFDTLGDAVVTVGGLIDDAFGEGGGVGVLLDDIREMTGIDLSPFVAAFTGLGGGIQEAIAPLIATFTDARTPIEGFLDTLSGISPTFALARAAIEAAVGPIKDIILTSFGIVQGFLAEHGDKIRSDLTSAWQQIQAIIDEITPPIQAIVSAIFGNIALFLHAHGDDIKAFLGTTWDAIAQIISLALQLIQATLVPALQFIAGFITSHGAEIQAILSTTWEAIKLIINTALTLVKGIITAVLQAIRGDWSGAWETIKTMSATVVSNLLSLFKLGFEQIKIVILLIWSAIRDEFFAILNGIVGTVIQTMIAIANAIRTFGDQAMGAASALGSAIVSGITDGIKNGASAILNAARDAAMAALDAAKHALGISSPSRLFSEQIGVPMAAGIAEGLIGGAPMVAQAAEHAAGAAYVGARNSVTNAQRTVNATFNYHNTANAPRIDSAIVQSLAGV